MRTERIELSVDGCFTYIKVKDSDGFAVYRTNTTDERSTRTIQEELT